MKAKKVTALIMSAALAVGGVSLLAACKKDDNNGFKKDTNVWYAVGADKKGTLGNDVVGGWKPGVIREAATFKRDETVTNENVFTLTLDIYAGDISSGYSFKFMYKTSADEDVKDDDLWARQIGIENIAGYEGEGATAVVKLDGVTVFTTSDGSNAHNISLVKGNEGRYKFTLKTFPGTEKQPEITVTKESAITVTHEMFLQGDMSGFGEGGDADFYAMDEKVSGVNVTWSYMLEVTDADLKRNSAGELVDEGATHVAVNVFNLKDKKSYHVAENTDFPAIEISGIETDYFADKGTFNLLPKGRYSIEYNQATNAVTITAGTHDMYFRGSLMSWGTTITEEDAKYRLTESKDGTYWSGIVEVPAGQTAEVKLFNAKTGKWYGNGEANWQLTEGTWFFKFTLEGEVTTYEQYKYYIVGTLMDGTEKVNFAIKQGFSPELVAGENGEYSVELEIADVSEEFDAAGTWLKPNVAALKVAWGTQIGGIGNNDWFGAESNNGNVMISAAGTYTITLHVVKGEDGTVTKRYITAVAKA